MLLNLHNNPAKWQFKRISITNNYCASYIPYAILSALYTLAHLILTIIQKERRYYYLLSTYVKTEAQRG